MRDVANPLNTTGKRIRVLRQDLDLTQSEVARQMTKLGTKINASYISTLEGNDKMPSGEVLRGLARVLQTTTDYLLLLTDDPLIPSEEIKEAGRELTPEQNALLDSLEEIADSDRPMVYELVQSLADTWLRRRPRPAPRLGALQTPIFPRSNQDLRAALSVLSDEEVERLLGVLEDMTRNSDRNTDRPISER